MADGGEDLLSDEETEKLLHFQIKQIDKFDSEPESKPSCRGPAAPKQILPFEEIYFADQIKAELWNFRTLFQEISTSDGCLRWLAQRRLIRNAVECTSCRHPASFISFSGGMDKKRWSCRTCGFRLTIRSGSFFAHSHLSLYQIMIIIYCWSEDMSQSKIMHEAETTRQPVLDWCNFCREECGQFIRCHASEIGGIDENGTSIVVEIDENKYFTSKYNRDQEGKENWLLGGIERGSGRCFLVDVPDRTAETLRALIVKHVLPGSRIISDGWAMYANIETIEGGIYDYDVNHKRIFDPNAREIHTQTVKNMWMRLRRKMSQQFGTSSMLFSSYLDEFVFRSHFRGENIFSNFLVCLAENYML